MQWLKRLFGSILRRPSRDGVEAEVVVDSEGAVVAPATVEPVDQRSTSAGDAPSTGAGDAVDVATAAVAEATADAASERNVESVEPEPQGEMSSAPAEIESSKPAPIEAGSTEVESTKATDVDPAAPAALRPALAAFERGEFERALTAATSHIGHRDAAVRHQAQRLCAQSAAALQRWDDAFDHWLALFDDQPSAGNALQLATTSVMCDEAERGEAWLERFDQLNAGDLPPAQARNEFLAALAARGEMSLALPHLQWLRDAYLQLRDTDPALLQQHGLEPVEAFLADSLPILRGTLSPLDVRSWYSTFDGRLDERGQRCLQEWVTELARAA